MLHLKRTRLRGLFGLSALSKPENLSRISQFTINKVDGLVSQIITEPDPVIVTQKLDVISDSMCRVLDLAEFLRNVMPTSRFGTESDVVFGNLYQYMNELNTNVKLFAV